MNTLSWFLYFAGLVDKAAIFLGIVILVLFAAGVMMAIAGGINREFRHKGDDKYDRGIWMHYTVLPRILIAMFFVAVLFVLIPSKNTMYLIAASELGERISQTEVAQGIANDAHSILNGYLGKIKKELGVE